MSSTRASAVLIVAYNGMRWLPDCLTSIRRSPDAPLPSQIVIVDNASSDQTLQWLQQSHPELTVIRCSQNLGFAGGNNVGFAHIRSAMPHVRYVALLNQDTIVTDNWLASLVELIESDLTIGSVQSKLMLHPQTDRFNSAGNRSHYLGFGFTSAYREIDTAQHDIAREIAFASGAAMLLRVATAGPELFRSDYFAYLEDAELGWYLRIQGLRNLYCPRSIVYHRYTFGRNPQMYYWLERNRYRLMMTYYRPATVILLLPIMLAMEFGLLFYFVKAGAMRQKLRSWDWLTELRTLRQRRRQLQQLRRVSDRVFTSLFVANADFEEVRNPLLTLLGNPMLRAWWRFARLLMWW